MKKILLSILVVATCCLTSMAQTPQSFKYQAVARDLSGNVLVNQAVSFQISILQGSTSGSSVYTETQSATTNNFGLVNLEIGSGTLVSGDFSIIGWGSASYFVKIEMDATGGSSYVLMGISQLLSVPYALHAKTVEIESDTTHWKENSSNIYFNQGNVGIGTNLLSPINKLTVAGTGYETRLLVKADTNASLVFTVGATKNAKIYQNGTRLFFGADGVSNIGSIDLNAPGNSFAVDATGMMGIGTNVPSSKLTIVGGDVNVTDIGSGIIIKSPNGQCWRVTVSNTGSFTSTAITCP